MKKLLNGSRMLLTQDAGKTEVSKIFLASVFSSRASLQKSKDPEKMNDL